MFIPNPRIRPDFRYTTRAYSQGGVAVWSFTSNWGQDLFGLTFDEMRECVRSAEGQGARGTR